jgi:hypothetical protein
VAKAVRLLPRAQKGEAFWGWSAAGRPAGISHWTFAIDHCPLTPNAKMQNA